MLTLLPSLVQAQKYSHELSGKISVKGSDTYRYQLFFNDKNGVVTGYSLTWLQDTIANKAFIVGRVDSIKKILSFRETKIATIRQNNDEMCLIQGAVMYKQKSKKYVYSGLFTGKDKSNNYCGEGTLSFTEEIKNRSKDEEPLSEPHPIPANAIIWHSDSCIINIWDYSSIDGDVATILLNGKEVLSKYTITASRLRLHFALKEGLNTLEIKAANAQSIIPVSARIILADGDKTYEFAANNVHGKDAINIMKTK